jgi:hypothetical protein
MLSNSHIKAMLGALLRVVQTASDIRAVRSGQVYQSAQRLFADPGAEASAWTPFAEGEPLPLNRTAIDAMAVRHDISPTQVDAVLADMRKDRIMINNRYQVMIRDDPENHSRMLSIKRIDQQPIRDWRDLQRIKNELVGPECEGIELYPAESRLVDTANQYHLWCTTDATYRFPIGFTERLVDDEGAGAHLQRPFDR